MFRCLIWLPLGKELLRSFEEGVIALMRFPWRLYLSYFAVFQVVSTCGSVPEGIPFA